MFLDLSFAETTSMVVMSSYDEACPPSQGRAGDNLVAIEASVPNEGSDCENPAANMASALNQQNNCEVPAINEAPAPSQQNDCEVPAPNEASAPSQQNDGEDPPTNEASEPNEQNDGDDPAAHEQEAVPKRRKRASRFREYEVEKVLGKRINAGGVEYHLQWKGFPVAQSTWEPVSQIKADILIGEYEQSVIDEEEAAAAAEENEE